MDPKIKTDPKKYREQLRKQLLIIADILLIILAVFFIIIGFIYAIDKNDYCKEGLKNIRYGLFSLTLIFSGVYIVLSIYRSWRNRRPRK
jgi:TRAP-type C4-dicarboxylate transport system permease small subunit